MEAMKPRKIIVEIDNDAYEELRTEIGLKFGLENAFGFCDEFVLMVVKSIYGGLGSIHVTKRKKGHKRTKI
jgi:hypothetical protein